MNRSKSAEISQTEIFNEVKKQLSFEFNCSPDDFSKDENNITVSDLHEKRRKFSEKKFFIQMATFGKGTVISADESIHPWLHEWADNKEGFLNSIITMSLKLRSESTDIKCHLHIICSCLRMK